MADRVCTNPAVVGSSAIRFGTSPMPRRTFAGFGPRATMKVLLKAADDIRLDAFAARETEQPGQPLAGIENEEVMLTGDEPAKPFLDGCRILDVVDRHQRTADRDWRRCVRASA